MKEEPRFIQEGGQTKITETVKRASGSIPGDDFDFVVGALDRIGKNLKVKRDQPNRNSLFNRRTASQIIEDGFSTGCTDTALAFVALCRARSIPTKYVETIGRDWL